MSALGKSREKGFHFICNFRSAGCADLCLTPSPDHHRYRDVSGKKCDEIVKKKRKIPALALGAFISAAGICLLVYTLGETTPGFQSLTVAAIVALSVSFGYLASSIRISRDLNVLREGIGWGKEAIFKKPVTKSTGKMVTPLVKDFNEMLNVLDESFLEVDKCQTRMLTEKNKLKIIVESLVDGLISFDMNLKLRFYNSVAKSYLGLSNKTLGRKIDEILRMNENDLQFLIQSIEQHQSISHYECELYITDGSSLFMSVNLRFLDDMDDHLGECIITFRDISEKKQIQERLCHNEKLVATGQLAAGLAHELNNPLGNILGYARLIQNSINGDGETGAKLKVICEEADKCSRIIQQLLKLARRDRLELHKWDLNSVVDDVLINMECRFKEGRILLDADLSGDLPDIPFDRVQFEQAVSNVLINSVQALGEADVVERKIKIRTEELVGQLAIYISDNGPGVPENVINHIFEPFFTTKDLGDGTGLGLAITATIMQKHGGSIELVHTGNGNTCFQLTLPYQKETVEAA